MSGKMNICSVCNKVINRLDNLKRHERVCKLNNVHQEKKRRISPNDHALIDRIINGAHRSQPPTGVKEDKEDEVIKVNLHELNLPTIPNPKVKKLVVHSVPTQQYLPSSEEGLKEKLCVLYAEYVAGNTTTKPQITEILQEFRRRGILSNAEYEDVCHAIDSLEKSSSEESSFDTNSSGESSDTNASEESSSKNGREEPSDMDSSEKSSGSETDESEELDFDNLVKVTVENLTRNTRRNLYKALKEMDEDISVMVNNYLNGEEMYDDVMEKLAKTTDGLKVKMLLRSVEKTRHRVMKVLDTLRHIEDQDIGKVLDQLKLQDLITDEEFHRLLVSANNVLSYAKAIQGSGFWL